MGGLAGVHVKVVVSQHRAARRGNPDGAFLDAQLVDYFGHQAVDDAVPAAGAIVEQVVLQALGRFEYFFHAAPPSRPLG